ncbi:MAG: hypothetical protein OEU32_04650 [Acidimicrobiia bacterium]|nr:hypothetical protein [Acidimicrobiia bacterium]
MGAFAIAATTLVLTLAAAATVVSTISDDSIQELRTRGPRVKQLGGALLILIGSWFAYLALANPTYLLP